MSKEPTELTTMEQALIARLSELDARQWMKEQAAPYQELMAYYQCAMMEVETRVKILSEEFNLRYDSNPIESIKTRLKRPESIVDKLLRNRYPLTVESIEENISDVAGVRVICSFTSDVYMLAEALLRQDGITLVRERDYIASPKPSGYRSLNMVISVPIFLKDQKKQMKVEVQLRTLAMDCWASLEHKIRYKKNLPLSERLNEELFACSEVSAEIDRRMEEIRRETNTGSGT